MEDIEVLIKKKKIKVRAVKCLFFPLNSQMLAVSRWWVDETRVGVLADQGKKDWEFLQKSDDGIQAL